MSELDQDNLATDDSRRLLPRPEFDPARRRSGFPAYVSPRSRLQQDDRFLRFMARFDRPPEQKLGLLRGKAGEVAREAWLRQFDDD